jgi:nitrite reductase (NADH) large subunit
METQLAGVFAAGDVAHAPMWGGTSGVLALWPVAVAQGRVAGANLAGAGIEYEGAPSANVTEIFGVTVASMGRFEEGPGDEVVVLRGLPGVEHLKLVLSGDTPVGAVYVGGPQEVRLLGRLAPYIRCARPVDDLSAFLEERRVAGVGHATPWSPRRDRRHGSTRKDLTCAS